MDGRMDGWTTYRSNAARSRSKETGIEAESPAPVHYIYVYLYGYRIWQKHSNWTIEADQLLVHHATSTSTSRGTGAMARTARSLPQLIRCGATAYLLLPQVLRPNVTFYKFLKCFLHILRVKKIQVREL